MLRSGLVALVAICALLTPIHSVELWSYDEKLAKELTAYNVAVQCH